ncbi:hypothetical protein [Rhodopirellula sallentina]|nr:hypothetical protein [Rhodopirellula sallentina]
MKKILLALVVVLSLLAVPIAIYWTTEPVPVLGVRAPAEYVPHPHGALASSTVVYPTLISPGGSYRVGVDSSNVVRLVFPTGDRFSTPDGVSTSSTLADVQAVSNSPVISDGKFGYTVCLPSGWIARFDAADGAPTPDTLVASVFSR